MNIGMRVEDIARKLFLKENEYVRNRLSEWIEKSGEYADMMIRKYGFNKAQATRKGYQVLYLMNKICPILHHFKKMPSFKPWDKDSWDEYNRMSTEYTLENTQIGLVDESGKLLQEGVHYTDEEYDAFMVIVEEVLKEVNDGQKMEAR